MAITLSSLGAAGEVTGSKHLLEVDGARLLFDCGAFQGKRGESDRKNREFRLDGSGLASVVLTHAHYDHCGLLPVIGKGGYRGNIYATPATRDLAAIIMMDSAKIQARDAEYLRKQAAKQGKPFTWEPLFAERDVTSIMEQFVTLSYRRSLPVAEGAELTFYDAGHILGSAIAHLSVRRKGEPELRIAFTGDLGRKHKAIIRDPEAVPDVDYLVLESTYGDRLHESSQGASERLASIVKATADRGGKIVIPAFAIERTQEIVYLLHLLEDRKRIPSLPIYVDSPMATNATSIFQLHPECYDEETNRAFVAHHKNPFGFNALHYVASVAESKELNTLKGPAIIISADGMCEAGRIQHHLIHTVGDPRNTILIVGYMAENTLGRRIANREPEVRILDDLFHLKAQVEEIDAFSAHADYREMAEYLAPLDKRRLKRIFLVHGEPPAQAALKGYLVEQGFSDVEIVAYGKRYELAP